MAIGVGARHDPSPQRIRDLNERPSHIKMGGGRF